MSVSRIIGNNAFIALKGKNIMNNRLHINNCINIQQFSNPPTFQCKQLFLTNCDGNFQYYWLRDDLFPKTELIYLDYSSEVHHISKSFNPKKVTIITPSTQRDIFFKDYKNVLCPLWNREKVEEIIKSMEEEPLQIKTK